MKKLPSLTFAFALLLVFNGAAVSDDDDRAPILPQLPGSPLQVTSTMPANGDVNPYGVAFVPHDFPSGGTIHAGEILVSNFNNSGNLQGTGTTIVAITGNGTQTLFFQGQAGLGLTTALGVLSRGVVLVGNMPTTDGSFNTVKRGSLIAIDRSGKQIASFSDSTLLDGPWDLTVADSGGAEASVFVSSALNGTVSRLDFDVSQDGEHILLERATQIASGYLHRGDPNALVIGPTGLAFDPEEDTLFVASTGDNAIYAVDNAARRSEPAARGRLVYSDNAHFAVLSAFCLPRTAISSRQMETPSTATRHYQANWSNLTERAISSPSSR